MTSRKRSRSVPEENRAECPFTISYPSLSRSDQSQKGKKRKREGGDDEKKNQVQLSPFAPTGKFKNSGTLSSSNFMDLHYTVEPRKRWLDMTRYNSFVLNGTKYYSEGFVFVANESTIEQQKAAPGAINAGPAKKKDTDWVARILEIRASDEHHVYARIYWMYSPDELPAGTIDGKKSVQGRQPYHGHNELIASNHMDIINVVSVTSPAKVNQWIETDDEEIQDALYWRQAYDLRSGQLSSVETMCKCEAPANPDKMLLGCLNSECGKWMHVACVENDVLMKTYNALGTDKPHISDDAKPVKTEERPTRPLSPTDIGENQTQPTIDVRSSGAQDNVLVKDNKQETPRQTKTATPIQQTPTTDAKSTAKKGRKKKGPDAKPYHSLFEATLTMNEGPSFCTIRDLRENVSGGDKTWTEKFRCLFCDTVID